MKELSATITQLTEEQYLLDEYYTPFIKAKIDERFENPEYWIDKIIEHNGEYKDMQKKYDK